MCWYRYGRSRILRPANPEAGNSAFFPEKVCHRVEFPAVFMSFMDTIAGEKEQDSMNFEAVDILNHDWRSGAVDRGALERALHEQGEAWQRLIHERCPHLFAAASLFVSGTEMEQMQEIIRAVQQAVERPAWREAVLEYAPASARYVPRARGVFFGYDFHLNSEGVHSLRSIPTPVARC